MQQRGVRAVVPLDGSPFGDSPGLAVIADSWWRAQQALSALAIVWSESPHTALTSSGIRETLRMVAQEREGFPFRSTGDAETVLDATNTTLEAGANRLHEAVYDAPYLAHATMEPPNATVQVNGTTAQVWTGTQMPDVARRAAATVLGLNESAVTLHQYRLGGGFGRRLEVDYVTQAARIAAALPGTPVCTIWSRTDDLRHDMYRPACAAQLRGAIDSTGALKALSVHSASQAPFQALSRRIGFAFTKHGPDRTTAEGAWDQPYEIPALHVAHAAVDFPVPVGLWRSVGHSHQAFFVESFIDELAHGADQDPLAFRLALLKQHARAAAVLRLAAERADWGTPAPIMPDGQPCARGLALHVSFGTIVAQIATVSLSPERTIRVHRVVSAIDCGLPVNPSGIEQQVEGAIVVGLSAALFGEVTIANGRVQPANFHEYRLLRHNECPVMETHIIARGEVPSGVGEPGLPPTAPAVANALFALTGTRLRSLPLRLPSTP